MMHNTCLHSCRSVVPSTGDHQREVYISNFLVYISNMHRDGSAMSCRQCDCSGTDGDKVLGLDPLKAEGIVINVVVIGVGRDVSVAHCNRADSFVRTCIGCAYLFRDIC